MNEELKKLKSKILSYQLAFENYYDNTSKSSELYNMANKMTLEIRDEQKSYDEKIKKAKEIIEIYEDLFNSLKEEEKKRFIFYDDDIEYIWDINLIKK